MRAAAIALLLYGTTAGGLLSDRYLGLRASRRGGAACLYYFKVRVPGLVRAARHCAAAIRHHRGRPALRSLPGTPRQQARGGCVFALY